MESTINTGSNRKFRKNGCSFPPNRYQMLLCATMLLQILMVNLIIVPSIGDIILRWIMLVSINVFILLVIILLILTTISDAGKMGSYDEGSSTQEKIQNADPEKVLLVWKTCMINVTPKHKHWFQWNKCIRGFDHHCVWLNNWVGSNNYTKFLIFTGSYALFNIMLFWIWIAFIALHNGNTNFTNEHSFFEFYNTTKSEIWYFVYSIVWLLAVTCILTGGFTTGLLIFHWYLKLRDITTYQFVMDRRNSKIAR